MTIYPYFAICPQMREDEFVCLKALAFLHPEAKGLSQQAQQLVRETRNRILKG